MTPLRIAIHGAAGRMGQRLVALAKADPTLSVVAALESPGHPRLGQDVGTLAGAGPLGVPLSAELNTEVDAVIDFSVPRAVDAIVRTCVLKRTALVVATTGLADDQASRLREAAASIPLLWSPNMSLAVNLTMKLAEVAARALRDKDADVEILERHHRFKEDSPSGTALKFGQIIAGVMGQTVHRHGREGRPGPRPHHEIGYHAIRVGDNPGEHTIVFGMLGETIEVVVRATNRDCYAAGALAAARFLADKPPGLYTMADVLGL
ncbi:MAG: 4-hydroxy-tetrahydrodipicolinate reductase [Thermoguttaceae bacterium]|nr:4-hydroxy-tetrahydrodipicolinate reductase [Thermoguttaceae bacterium]